MGYHLDFGNYFNKCRVLILYKDVCIIKYIVYIYSYNCFKKYIGIYKVVFIIYQYYLSFWINLAKY